MKSEYKRDINGNYLVLYENEEPDNLLLSDENAGWNSIPLFLMQSAGSSMDSLWCVMTLPPK